MGNIYYEVSFLKALATTISIECLIAYIVLTFSNLKQIKQFGTYTILLVCVLATLTTLPYLWFVLPAFIKTSVLYHILGETMVVIIEFCIYALFLKSYYKQLFILAFVANLGSYLLGLYI